MSYVDHDGNTLAVGDELYIPAKVVALLPGGAGIEISTAYSNTNYSPVASPDTHQTQNPNWPSVP
jgi:hypothetical protein